MMTASCARTTVALGLALAATLVACAPAVPHGELAPVAHRSTNQMRHADLQVLDDWTVRLRALEGDAAGDSLPRRAADPGRSRALAMAAAWLAFARDEYVRAPASPVVDAAFAQARRIITDGEAGRPMLMGEAPLVLGTVRVRSDLWSQLERLRTYSHLEPAVLGEVAVLLVRAGRVSIPGDPTVCDPAPFLARAEQVVGEMVATLGRGEKEIMLAGMPAAVAPPRVQAKRIPMPVLVRSVHFALDRDSVGPAGRQILDVLVRSLDGRAGVVIELQGFADPRGSAAYNVALSRRRALSVQRYIEERSTAVARFDIRPLGSARTGAAGTDRVQLARDRRVDLRVILPDGSESQRTDELDGDLQLERERPPERRTGPRTGH